MFTLLLMLESIFSGTRFFFVIVVQVLTNLLRCMSNISTLFSCETFRSHACRPNKGKEKKKKKERRTKNGLLTTVVFFSYCIILLFFFCLCCFPFTCLHYFFSFCVTLCLPFLKKRYLAGPIIVLFCYVLLLWKYALLQAVLCYGCMCGQRNMIRVFYRFFRKF